MPCIGETAPKARTDRIVVRELGDEILIYDLDSYQATCLNAAAGRVWKLCNGQNTIRELTLALECMRSEYVIHEDPIAGEPNDDIVLKALDELMRANLLIDFDMPKVSRGPSRRRLLRNILGSAVTIPMVTTITVPTAMAMASCGGMKNDPCSSHFDCCPGFHCQSPPGKCRPD